MNAYASLLAAILGILITALSGYFFVPFLHKLKFGQTIREIGPSWHKKKEGTPTMGGVMIILGTIFAVVLAFLLSSFFGGNTERLGSDGMRMSFFGAGIGLAVGMGFIGFLDDYIKVVKKRNLGLTAKQKTFLQLFISAAYLLSLHLGGMTTTWIPFLGEIDVTSGFGLIFWPIALMFIYGFTNAVNLTDGVDGLATTVTMVVCCLFMIISAWMYLYELNILAAASAGACIGFLFWNNHPAKVFMGDTGSLFLGGLVVGLSFGIGKPILLILAGIIYISEAFSVMLQVAYYKKTKKRLFKMSPLHHHFELSGWSEERIVLVFSLVTLVGCVISALLSKFS